MSRTLKIIFVVILFIAMILNYIFGTANLNKDGLDIVTGIIIAVIILLIVSLMAKDKEQNESK